MTKEERDLARDNLLSWIILQTAKRSSDPKCTHWQKVNENEDLSTHLKVSLTVEGIEVPLYQAFADFTEVLDELIRDEALALLEERLGDFVETIKGLQERVIQVASKELS